MFSGEVGSDATVMKVRISDIKPPVVGTYNRGFNRAQQKTEGCRKLRGSKYVGNHFATLIYLKLRWQV